MKFKIDVKQIFKSILLAIAIFLPIIIFFNSQSKKQAYRMYKNRQIYFGNYVERRSGGRGTVNYVYDFKIKNNNIKGSMSTASFPNNTPYIGQEFIVLYNGFDPSESSMFFNLRVTDSIKKHFKKGPLRNIPIESYQRSIDSFYYISFFKGISKFIPPYYTKEDFPELEYLWGEEE